MEKNSFLGLLHRTKNIGNIFQSEETSDEDIDKRTSNL